MTKKRPFFERIVSMLLVAVMVIGLLPTSVFANSGGDTDHDTNPVGPTTGKIFYNTSDGAFTRFTLIHINAADCDSTYDMGEKHDVDLTLNPGANGRAFDDINNYSVVGSVNIGAKDLNVRTDAVFFKTNALDYLKQCLNTSDAASRKSAINSYLNANKTSYNDIYYHWDTWCYKMGFNDWGTWADTQVGHGALALPVCDKNFSLDKLMNVGGQMNTGGDTTTYGSASEFTYSLLHYFGLMPILTDEVATNPNISQEQANCYWSTSMNRWVSKYFRFDGETYRIIAEPGLVITDGRSGTRYAVTARDLAAMSLNDETIAKGIAAALRNAMNGLTDKFNQPHGYYAKSGDSAWNIAGFDVVTVANNQSNLWTAGTENAWKPGARYQMFGLDSTGTTCTDKYPALGMGVYMPLRYDPVSVGLTITKTVTNTGEEYANMDWRFSLVLTLPDGAATTGPFKVRMPDGSEPEYNDINELWDAVSKFTLKSGQYISIEGLPEGTQYTVTEMLDEVDQSWQSYVTDTGASDTSELESDTTTGTVNDSGSASVTFRNTKPGGPAHLIVDYNLPGATATYDEETGTITSENIVKCGIHPVGEEVAITPAFNGRVLKPGEVITLNQETKIYAKFLGLFTSPGTDDGGRALDYDTVSGNYTWVLGHEDLTVIYARWSLTTDDIDPLPPGEGQIYTVFWDYNYDGGGVTSSLAGTYKYTGSVSGSCACGGFSGSYEFELPIQFSVPDPPVREGFTFIGWSLDPTDTTGSTTPTDPGGFDTYYGIWMTKRTTWSANGGTFTNGDDEMYYEEEVIPRGKTLPVLDMEPVREGYTFNGWYLDSYCTQPLEGYEEGVQPGRTYYAGWTAERVIVTYYDTRDGTGVLETQYYNYDDLLTLFTGLDDTVGWEYVDWNTSFDGSGMSGAEAEGRFLNTDEEKGFGDLLVYHEGAAGPTEPDPEDPGVVSDRGYWTLDFYAQWRELTGTYNVQIVWNDFLNNDGARPTQIELGLVDSYNNNTIIERIPVTDDPKAETWSTQIDLEHITDNDSSLQKRTYKIVFLSYTDIRGEVHQIQAPEIDGQEGTMELAAPSLADASRGVNTVYSYGVNNYAPDHTGTGEYDTLITFNHSLITTGDDIQFTIDWDDDNDNDGVRPKSVMLVLYANGVPVSEFPMHNAYTGEVQVSAALCDVANDGDTWTYTFKDYQRYNDGKAIDYTVAIKNPDKTTTFNLNGYTTTYIDTNGDSEIGDHNGCTVSRPIELHEVPFSIIWDDENNRDGQRPEFVSVSLMSYQWNDHTYQWEYVEMATQTVRADDVNTMTAGEWTGVFELDADSLKYPVYHDGLEAIYHLVVTSDLNAFIPEGSFEYGWVESAYGNQKKVTPQVIISQNTNTVSVTANVYWNDSQNNDDIRPENIILQLYSHAPGEEPVAVPGAAYRVTISGDKTADNWYYTFSGMPKYAEGQSGVELIYTIQVFEVDGEPLYGYYIIDANGEEQEVLRYEASYLTEATENDDNIVGDGTGTAGDEGTVETDDFTESDRAYVKLTHIAETQTMNFSVNWHDEDNRDNVRPEHVMVDLYKTVGDNTPVFVQTLDITENKGTWTYRVTGLAGYENGLPVRYSIEVPDDVQQQLASLGYTVTTQDNIVHLYYTPGTGSITTQIYWSDDDNNDGYRPDSVIAELYANGVATGKTVDLNATNNWTWTWNDLPVNYVDGTTAGVEVVYSVKVQVPDKYSVTYNPVSTTIPAKEILQVQLFHGGDVMTVPVTVYWNDKSDYDQRRPDSVTLQLVADGEVTNHQITLTADNADASGNVWTGSFENMPVYSGDGHEVYYSLNIYDTVVSEIGYREMTAGTTLYLSRDMILSNMYVSFRFNDKNNVDGQRPTGLYLQLTANGVPVDDSEYLHTVSFDQLVDGNRWDFGELPVYAGDGSKIAYNVVVKFDPEFGATDYDIWTSADIRLSENTSGSAPTNQIIVKLSRDTAVTSQSGRVFWFDVNDMFGQRPDTLTLTLSSNANDSRTVYVLDAVNGTVTDKESQTVVGTVEVQEWDKNASVWLYTIENLPKNYTNSAGESARIYYWVTANPTNIAEYYGRIISGEDMGMDVSLTHVNYSEYAAESAQDYTLNIQWLDNQNAWGYRPDSNGVMVDLLANGTVYDTITLTEANMVSGNHNAWTYTWKDIPTFRDGDTIVWSVRVADADKYTQERTIYTAESTTVVYRQSVGFNFTVNWNDSDNDDAVRPSDVTVNVFADGTHVGSVKMTGEGNTWTGSIADMIVWRESDPDAAIQYTFQWSDETAGYLAEEGYLATPTKNGAEIDSSWFYYLSAEQFGDNNDVGYDQLAGTYEWETTLNYDKEVADYFFSVSFDDDADRDGIRPESLSVNLLANGNVIDTREITINQNDTVYPLVWEDQEVWDNGERIVYTIELVDVPTDYSASYNDAHTDVTLTHAPYRISVTGSVIWDDASELRDVLNPNGEYVRSYEKMTRVGVYMQLLANGEPFGEPVYISENSYGDLDVDEVLEKVASKTWSDLYQNRDHGDEIVYTISVYSDELTALLEDGHSMTPNFETKYEPFVTISHDLYDIRGTVYYQYDTSDDFLLKNVRVVAYLMMDDETWSSQGTTFTDENGQFEFLNLPQGLYTIRATYNYTGTEMAGTQGAELDRQDENGVVVIVDRESANDGDYYRYKATGQAFYQTDSTDDSTIHPVPAGSIALLYKLEDGSNDPVFVKMDTIGENGRYEFEDLNPSNYLVNIVFNYEDGIYTYDNTDAMNDGLSFVVVGADATWPDIIKQVNADTDIKDPEIPEEPVIPEPEEPVPCIVSGYVFWSDNGVHTQEPIEGVDVHLYVHDSNLEIANVQTDDRGFWTTEGLTPGNYVAVFSMDGHQSRVLVFTISETDYETGTFECAPQYFDKSSLTPAGRIEGTVLNNAGYPMRAMVYIYDEDGNVVDFSYTDTKGQYKFTVGAGFDYEVKIMEISEEVSEYTAGDPDDALTELDRYLISGIFTVEGVPQPGELVALYYDEANNGEYKMVNATLTGDDGKFVIEAMNTGNYKVVPYINEEIFDEWNVTVSYREEQPTVTKGANGTYTISGVDDYDEITLYHLVGNERELAYSNTYDSTQSSYEIVNQDAGRYELLLKNGGASKTYYFMAPEDSIVNITYLTNIEGDVKDAEGNAILGAQVQILNSDGEQVGETTIIRADGHYAYHGLPEGKYTVRITKPTAADTMADRWTYEPDSYGTVYADGMAEDGLWVWNINARTISGTVTDQKGRPIEGAIITFRPFGSQINSHAVTTDENGDYIIGLAPGEYSVDTNYYWDAKHQYKPVGSDYVDVTNDVTDFDFTVYRYDMTVETRRATDDEIVPNANVSIYFTDGTEYYEGTTDEYGQLTVPVFSDKYIVMGNYDGARVQEHTDVITADTTVTLYINSQVYISGTVTNQDGEPVTDGIVYYDNGSINDKTYTNEDGTYEIAVPANEQGEFSMWAEADRFQSEYQNVTVSGDTVCDFVIDMAGDTDNRYVTGVVTDEEGNRLANAEVDILYGDDKTRLHTTSTNELGEYQFTVPDGTYYLRAYYEDHGYRYESNADYAVHVNGSDVTQDLVVLMGYPLVVTVYDADGIPVPNAEVYYTLTGQAYGGHEPTNSSGVCELYVPKGEYRVYAKTESRSSDAETVVVDGYTAIDLYLTNVGIAYEEPEVTGNELTMWGYVYNPQGNPVEGADVTLYKQDFETLEWSPVNAMQTDSEGYYEFTGLEEGVYRVDTVYTEDVRSDWSIGGYIIEGNVTDAEGNPMSNCTVELWDGENLIATGTTDDEGYYRFDEVDPDVTYRVTVTDASGEPYDDFEAVVKFTEGHISGRVETVAGKIVEGAEVTLKRVSDDSIVATMQTDETGEYDFIINQDGEYYLTVTYPYSYEVDTDSYVRDTTDRNAPYLAESWFTIEGYVHDDDGNLVEGAYVTLTPADDDSNVLMDYTTAADGYYIFDHLEDGLYHVHVYFRDKEEQVYEVDTDGTVTDVTPEEPEPEEPENIQVTITNLSMGDVIEPESGWVDGLNTFMVDSSAVLRVFYRDAGGELTELRSVDAGGNRREFSVEAHDGGEIVLVTLGDADLDGFVTVTDSACIMQASVGISALSEYAELAADIDRDSVLTVTDAAKAMQCSVGVFTPVWLA